jgi:predicted small lipoprotein YifL
MEEINMKKLILIVLTLTLVLSLAACGAAQPAETPAATTAAAAEETTGADQTTQAADPAELAKSCIDKPLSELIALIGEPESSDYAPSCLNPGQGEDGMLYYDGFVVYTYKEGDTETVQDVE